MRRSVTKGLDGKTIRAHLPCVPLSPSCRAYRGWETRRQNDERVAVNIAPDLLPLWDRIKGQFKGTPEERFEAFDQYASEHGSEIDQAVNDEAEEKLAREIARFEAQVEFVEPATTREERIAAELESDANEEAAREEREVA